ncbi:Serine protease 33, partial [Orchesella cincta]
MTVSSFIDRDHDLTDEIFPWHVAIFRRFADTTTFKYACGATLINPADRGFVVLTAAHCVTKHDASAEPGSLNAFKIVLGPISTDYRTNVIGNAQIFTAKRIVIDGEYNPDSGISDIGMIEVNGDVKLSDTVQPVCFPTRSVANAQVRPGIPGESSENV